MRVSKASALASAWLSFLQRLCLHLQTKTKAKAQSYVRKAYQIYSKQPPPLFQTILVIWPVTRGRGGG